MDLQFLPTWQHHDIDMDEVRRSSNITFEFCPSLDLRIVTVVETTSADVRYALGVVRGPGGAAAGALCKEFTRLVLCFLVIEQLSPHPVAKVGHFACHLPRRGA